MRLSVEAFPANHLAYLAITRVLWMGEELCCMKFYGLPSIISLKFSYWKMLKITKVMMVEKHWQLQ